MKRNVFNIIIIYIDNIALAKLHLQTCVLKSRQQKNTNISYCQMFISVHFLSTSLVPPSAKIATWRYWFRLSRDVYGGNRSFASYTKTKMVESAV